VTNSRYSLKLDVLRNHQYEYLKKFGGKDCDNEGNYAITTVCRPESGEGLL
jgi:hypothetical protein